MDSSAANVLDAYWPLVLTTSQVKANTRTHAQELWAIQPLPTAPQSRRRRSSLSNDSDRYVTPGDAPVTALSDQDGEWLPSGTNHSPALLMGY